jgi:hypothetical protein
MILGLKVEHRLYEKYFEGNNMKQVIIFIISGLFISLNLSIQAAPINVTYTIKTDTGQTPISKYIYGSNWGNGTDYTIQRTVGNRCTAYNWENNWSNAGSDWYYENDQLFDSNAIPGEGITMAIDKYNAMGQESIITLQLAGYVSAPIFRQINVVSNLWSKQLYETVNSFVLFLYDTD